MASVQATSAVCKNRNYSAPPKFLHNSFLTGFDITGQVSCTRKKDSSTLAYLSGVRATLTFDPHTTNDTKAKERKHTVDPSAPDFLPLPSFEECFPKSTKECK